MGVKDSDLSEVRDQLGLLVLRTRALAMESGREQELQIGAERLALETNEETIKFPRTLEIPPGIKLEIQVWPNDRWIIPEKDVSWLFQPNGICMPLSFRFSKGTSFVSFRIHPLTGAVDQESRMIERKP